MNGPADTDIGWDVAAMPHDFPLRRHVYVLSPLWLSGLRSPRWLPLRWLLRQPLRGRCGGGLLARRRSVWWQTLILTDFILSTLVGRLPVQTPLFAARPPIPASPSHGVKLLIWGQYSTAGPPPCPSSWPCAPLCFPVICDRRTGGTVCAYVGLWSDLHPLHRGNRPRRVKTTQ